MIASDLVFVSYNSRLVFGTQNYMIWTAAIYSYKSCNVGEGQSIKQDCNRAVILKWGMRALCGVRNGAARGTRILKYVHYEILT